MALNVSESHAVLRIIDHVTGMHSPGGREVTRAEAIDALVLLAEAASKRLLVGSGERARDALEQHWRPGDGA